MNRVTDIFTFYLVRKVLGLLTIPDDVEICHEMCGICSPGKLCSLEMNNKQSRQRLFPFVLLAFYFISLHHVEAAYDACETVQRSRGY